MEGATVKRSKHRSHRKNCLVEYLETCLNNIDLSHVVKWWDKNEGIFQILWVHGGRSSYQRNIHGLLFDNYRTYRGRRKTGDAKQSFRMALEKSPCVVAVPSLCTNDWRFFKFIRKCHDKRESLEELQHVEPEKMQNEIPPISTQYIADKLLNHHGLVSSDISNLINNTQEKCIDYNGHEVNSLNFYEKGDFHDSNGSSAGTFSGNRYIGTPSPTSPNMSPSGRSGSSYDQNHFHHCMHKSFTQLNNKMPTNSLNNLTPQTEARISNDQMDTSTDTFQQSLNIISSFPLKSEELSPNPYDDCSHLIPQYLDSNHINQYSACDGSPSQNVSKCKHSPKVYNNSYEYNQNSSEIYSRTCYRVNSGMETQMENALYASTFDKVGYPIQMTGNGQYNKILRQQEDFWSMEYSNTNSLLASHKNVYPQMSNNYDRDYDFYELLNNE